MKKRILLVLGAMLAIVAGGIWFAAEESYVLNIKATLSTALDVTPHGDWNLGVVYAQQKYDADLAVELSSSAKADPNLSSVAYNVGCNKPSPIGNGTSAAGPVSLCPYISIIDNDPENSLPGQNLAEKDNSFVSGNIGLTVQTQPHLWKIQVDPPTCVSQKDPEKQSPVEGSCDQDNPLFLAGVVFVQLAAVNQSEKVPCEKKDPNFNSGCASLTGEFQFSATADSLSGKAQIVEIHFGKNTQVVWIDQVSAYSKDCVNTASSSSFFDHEKGVDSNPDHEVWRVDFGFECIQSGATIKLGVDKTVNADFTTIKVINLLDGSGAAVGTATLN